MPCFNTSLVGNNLSCSCTFWGNPKSLFFFFIYLWMFHHKYTHIFLLSLKVFNNILPSGHFIELYSSSATNVSKMHPNTMKLNTCRLSLDCVTLGLCNPWFV